MDFGNLTKGLGNDLTKGLGNELLNNIDVQGLLKGFISENGLKISASDIKTLLANETVKQALINAAKAIIQAKLGTKDVTSGGNLQTVADSILKKAPDVGLTKDALAGKLTEYIKDNTGG